MKYGGVERITVLRGQPDGQQPRPQVLYQARRSRRRRRSGGMGWVEQLTHEAARAASTGANAYLAEHERSNRRDRDGWLRDLPMNMWTAAMAGKRRFWYGRDAR